MAKKKNYTSLHTPLNLEKLERMILAKMGRKTPLTKLDIALIVIGIVTTIILGILVYSLYLKDSGAL